MCSTSVDDVERVAQSGIDPERQLFNGQPGTIGVWIDGLDLTLTWCAPNGYRAAFVRLTATNHRTVAVPVTLAMKASFGRLSRVTYVPVALRGERTVGPSPWVEPGEVFSYITHDTEFAWALVHPGSTATTTAAMTSSTCRSTRPRTTT